MTGAARLYFEDVQVPGNLETPAMTVTQAHVGLYAGIAQEPFEAPSDVPAFLPLCLVTGLGWRSPQPPLAVLAFLNIEWEMVAPLRVGEGATTAAGSVITSDVPPGAMGIARARQENVAGWVGRRRPGTPAAEAAAAAEERDAATGTDHDQ
jgi:hypothetical protein